MGGTGTFNPGEYGDSGGDAAAKKKARDKRLRDMGLPIEYSKDELLNQIDELLNAPAGPSAEDLFRQGLQGGGGMDAFLKAGQKAQLEQRQRTELPNLLQDYFDRYGPDAGGRVFRPSVMQQPSTKDLFGAVEQAATGPAPDLLFRDVFAENFGDFTKMQSPYDRFVADQAKELEQRFMTGVFNQFNQPGFTDQLRADYESLYRQKESGDFSGAGGSIPAFEDFIKNRITGDFRGFLQNEKPKLEQAFQLTAPKARGQQDAGDIAPLHRIL